MAYEPLRPGMFYHIYNRGNNGGRLFVQPRNYRFFLQRYAHYIEPVAETFAYCLLPNHFHLAIRTRTEGEQVAFREALAERGGESEPSRDRFVEPSRAFNNLFISYARAVNQALGRTGALFERPFHRKPVQDERYFLNVVTYIHRNPEHHGLVADFRAWPWSSYGAHLSAQETRLCREAVLGWFNGRLSFVEAHKRPLLDEGFEEWG